MICFAIVEDEDKYREQLMEYLQKFEKEIGEKIAIKTYTDGDEILEDYQAQFDVILMDVQMPFVNGMSAAEEIRKMDTEVVIIFITNLAQYAIKGYAVDALDYILKPISYFQFSQRLHRAIERMKKREADYITVSLKNGIKRFETSDIYYVESQGHNLIYVTKEGEFTAAGTMKDLEKELSKFYFFRGHRGYLINLEHVEGMTDSYAVVNDEHIPISRAQRKTFMTALTDYWGEVIK